MSVWSTAQLLTKVEWRSATEGGGAQCVMMAGTQSTLPWSAGSWDSMIEVREIAHSNYYVEHCSDCTSHSEYYGQFRACLYTLTLLVIKMTNSSHYTFFV